MSTRYYTRKEVIELLSVDDGFLVSLETEQIVTRDAPSESPGEFSERMLERVRVALTLTRDLDVNLPGVAVIVRMREELAELRRGVEQLRQRTSRQS